MCRIRLEIKHYIFYIFTLITKQMPQSYSWKSVDIFRFLNFVNWVIGRWEMNYFSMYIIAQRPGSIEKGTTHAGLHFMPSLAPVSAGCLTSMTSPLPILNVRKRPTSVSYALINYKLWCNLPHKLHGVKCVAMVTCAPAVITMVLL